MSVTGKVRRVGRFDWELAKKAVVYNKPTDIAVMGVDYLNVKDYKRQVYDDLSTDAYCFLARICATFDNNHLSLIGTGPGLNDVIRLPKP